MSGPRHRTLFADIGRFAVRRRWFLVIGWPLATVVAVVLLPSLGSIVKNDNAAFLPASSPSVVAARLAAPFLVGDQQVGTIIVARHDERLSPPDQAYIDGLEARLRQVRNVVSVRDGAVSVDGSARTAIVEFAPATAGGGAAGSNAVAAVRAAFGSGVPPGLFVHLTGPLPELVDQQHAGNRTANHVQIISAILIIFLLLVAFRSPLAPLATLAPALLALFFAEPLIAASAHLGVQISSLLQLVLTALVLGAGTDYGLFLVFRYRENLRRGLEPQAAIEAAVEKVGESITFSAATVIGALLTLLLAGFGLYRGVGPGLAIGVAVVLVVELTFFPALLAVLGRAVFWPAVPEPGPVRPGRWGAVAARVSGQPVTALAVGVTVLGALALSLLAYAPSGFDPGGFIVGSDSGIGQDVLVAHFGPASVDATYVLFRYADPVWSDPQVLDQASDGLFSSREFTSVTGALQANEVGLPPEFLGDLYRRLGPPGELPAVQPPHTGVAPFAYNTYRAVAGFVSDDGRTVLYRVSLRAGSPGSTAALQAVPSIRRAVASVGSSVGAFTTGVAGQAAAAADVSSISGADIVRIAPVVFVVLALLLALVLRSLVAPLYLVASVALSYLASLGLAVLIFVVFGHQLGINFTLPFFMFVFIMALGEDYNILVMSRIREEAVRLPLRPAVAAAISTTGTTVTSAGLVLAGTFGVLAVATSGQIRQIGTGLALGILLDTFVVRTLLVPSTVVLLGPWNWWPSRLFSAPPPADGPSADTVARLAAVPTGSGGT
ncbi:MAG TPA: MMPL family transporter [Acidimicrobiales bacterium]|nr:MMPL family transporter [Acidimicrobiales bacterium]